MSASRMVLWLREPFQGHSVIGGEFGTKEDVNGKVEAFVADMQWYLLIFKIEEVREVALIKEGPDGCPYPIVDPLVHVINGDGMVP